jgi:eukaryotic-like serine/threonine-protein kinase
MVAFHCARLCQRTGLEAVLSTFIRMSASLESSVPVGTILVGKYKVSREVGRGGMAAVYEAEHLSLSKKVAIKILSSELTASKVVSERFFREARAAASVKSPHIVDVYDSGRLEDGRPFIVMELLEGESLYDRMARVRIIDFETTARLIADCARGLSKAHAVGIVHRDLKPENIFMLTAEDGTEYAKILDFGLAKFYSPTEAGETKTARLTREGAVFGTPAYMSPEQVKGQGTVDQRSDLWALGCMAYECLTGRPVWNTDQGVAMTFAAIATAPLPVPSKVYPGIPESFDTWFRKALERDVAKRFQTSKELADALTVALGASKVIQVKDERLSSRELKAASEILASARVLPASGETGEHGALSDSLNTSAAKLLGEGSPRLPEVADVAARATPLAPAADPSLSSVVGLGGAPLSTTAPVSASQPSQPVSVLRYLLATVLFAGAAFGVAYAWVAELRPQIQTRVVEATPIATVTATAKTSQPAPSEELKWGPAFVEGQRLLSGGDLQGAQRKFKEAGELGAGAAAKGMLDQTKAAAEGGPSCKMTSLTRPRLGIFGSAGRPAVISLGAHALVVWTDDHEQARREHAYGAFIDKAGVITTPVRDLTPEGTDIERPVPLKAGDQVALFYWEKSGKEAGARARILDAEGRIEAGIGGESRLLTGTPGKGKVNWPHYAAVPGGFFIAWEDSRDGSDDLFVRRLGIDLQPKTPEVRITDYRSGGKGRTPSVHVPAVAAAANALVVAYRLDRDNNRSLMRTRIALTAPELSKGLDEKSEGAAGPDRELGDTKSLSDEKVDAPSIACGTEGCFVAWHRDPGGAFVALLEPLQGRQVWHKQIVSSSGGRPSLGVGPMGDVAVTFYEQGKVKIAPLTRDGIGTRNSFAKVSGDSPRPYLTAGQAKGDWFVSWLDNEGGKPEPYVARLMCSR